jgi:hypothetical protein
MLESALTFVVSLDRISFKGTADTFRAWRSVLASSSRARAADGFFGRLLIGAWDELSHRPYNPLPLRLNERHYLLPPVHEAAFCFEPFSGPL